jgi:uncharacterized membrane protein
MSTVLLAVFKDYDIAARVRSVLVQDGFPTDRVDLTATRELGRASLQPADSAHAKCVQYFRTLFGRDGEQEYPEKLAERIDSGGATLTVLPRGAIETERATQILQHAHPTEVLGHDLTIHGWEHAAARHEAAWAQYVWVEHGPDDPDCIYCRMFPPHALNKPPQIFSGMAAGAAFASAASGMAAATAAPTAPTIARPAEFQRFGIRRVGALESLVWLREGWDDLKEIRTPSLMHGILIAILGAVLLIIGSSHPYFIAAAMSGYLLIGPVMTTGVCELSRRRAAGEPLGFDESLQGIARNPQALIQFGAILAAITLVWFVASEVMLRSVLHSSGPSVPEVLWGGFTDTASREQILAYVGSGAVLALLVFATSVVTVPLIVARQASATEAMLGSIRATFHNIPAMLIWAGIIVVLTTIGFMTLLLGMVIIAPLLGHATWHAYRRLIE